MHSSYCMLAASPTPPVPGVNVHMSPVGHEARAAIWPVSPTARGSSRKGGGFCAPVTADPDVLKGIDQPLMRPARASWPDGYLLGSYRIATAPEPSSSRLTSLKSTCFDSPANNVGPWPALQAQWERNPSLQRD